MDEKDPWMRRLLAGLALAALLAVLVRKRRPAAATDPEGGLDAPYKIEPDPRLYQ